jgi:pimeloyl-ACP methyl ester carboxylesterase
MPQAIDELVRSDELTQLLSGLVHGARQPPDMYLDEDDAGEDDPSERHSRLIKPGSSRQKLFLIPSAEGTASELRQLAGQIGGGRAIHAFQSIGLDGRTAPPETIEAIAATYLDEIRRVQPVGPYAIAGCSMGGLIAFELAQRLTDLGERVAPLMLIDTALPFGSWPLAAKLGAWDELLRCYLKRETWLPALQFHLDCLRRLIRPATPSHLLSRVRRAWNALTDVSRLQIHLTRPVYAGYIGEPGADVADISATVRLANTQARLAYRPRAYAGKVILLQSASSAPLAIDPWLWRRLAHNLEVLTVPGVLAETITRLLHIHRATDHRPTAPASRASVRPARAFVAA